MKIQIEKICKNAQLPTRGSEYAAGFDIYANFGDTESRWDYAVIYPGETKIIGTGVKMEIPVGYFGAIFARSGLAAKHGLRPANCVGVIDSDYRGEIKVALHNDGKEPYEIKNGDRIAQFICLPCLMETEFEIVEALNESCRGEGGFGSTG